jgi:hypothetical protein
MPPKSVVALNGDQGIEAEVAVELRDAAREAMRPDPVFSCMRCGEVVFPHKHNIRNGVPAHFEHRAKSSCPLSSG